MKDEILENGGYLYPDRIKLKRKLTPTCEAKKANFTRSDYWVEYGNVEKETRAIRERLEAEGNAIWDPENQTSNIRLKRAFHDSLGVRQVCFVFCDDLLRRVYELPWWKSWSRELEPLFHKLGIPTKLVIRCLLAYLPPGMNIPVHHDTGLWTFRSHRVHVPIITSPQTDAHESEVVFKVGHCASTMRRVPFVEAEAIELNNRAKHTVQNNWSQARIHLIFDYVEPETRVPRRVLDPGETVIQTRRAIFLPEDAFPLDFSNVETAKEKSVDRAAYHQIGNSVLRVVREKGIVVCNTFVKNCQRYSDGECSALEFLGFLKRALGGEEELRNTFSKKLPLLIGDRERRASLELAFDRLRCGVKFYFLLGAMKCGTTSLYDYIIQHPGVLRAKSKEPHFLDWKYEAVRSTPLSRCLQDLSQGLVNDSMSTRAGDVNMLEKFLSVFNLVELGVRGNVKIIGEATPSYMLGGLTVARRLEGFLGGLEDDVKFIVILRDPVARAYSHFNMTRDPTGTIAQRNRRGTVSGKSFQELIEEDIASLREVGIVPGVDPQVVDLDLFQKQYLDPGIGLGHGSHSYLGRGLYSLQLRQWFKVFPRERFLFLRLNKLSSNVQQVMGDVFNHLGLDPFDIGDTQARNTRKYDKLDDKTKATLEAFFEPFNQDLVRLLGPEFSDLT